MRLDGGLYEPILLKGNISHYYKSVIDGGAHGLSHLRI